MKNFIAFTLFLSLFAATTFSFAEEPRTVGVYKRHITSDEHSSKDFDHTLHHMLYLSGVTDGYAAINKQREAAQRAPLYCKPETEELSGADFMQILKQRILQAENPLPDTLTVAEAMLVALQGKYPCQ